MGEVTKTAVKDMAQKLSCGNAPNNVRHNADKEDDRKYKIELGNLKNQFEQNNHYKPNYEVSKFARKTFMHAVRQRFCQLRNRGQNTKRRIFAPYLFG